MNPVLLWTTGLMGYWYCSYGILGAYTDLYGFKKTKICKNGAWRLYMIGHFNVPKSFVVSDHPCIMVV